MTADHFRCRIGGQQGKKFLPAAVLRIEPDGLSGSGNNDGHAVVDGCQRLIGSRRDDRAGVNGATLRGGPRLVKTGETAGLAGPQVNEPRPFYGTFRLLPFVKTVGEDETAALPEGMAETGFSGDGFSPGVDQAVAGGGAFCPGGDEPPYDRT